MSVESFSEQGDKFVAAFEFTDAHGSNVVYYGIWTDLKAPQKYINTTLNFQHRKDQGLQTSGYGGNYLRPPNDAASSLRWRQGTRITKAWIAKLPQPEPVQDTEMVVDFTPSKV